MRFFAGFALAAVWAAALSSCEEASLGDVPDAAIEASDGGAPSSDAAHGFDGGSSADAGSASEDAWAMPPPVTWASCGDAGAECTKIYAPLDHQRPSTGTKIELHLTRHRATAPREREGVLFVSPRISDEVAATFYRLQERFDIIGIDARGTGGSSPLACDAGAFFDELRAVDPYVDLARFQAAAQSIGAACRDKYGDELVSHLSTIEAALDMELVRQALHEEQISFLGVGRGTLLGAVYATLYPSRVRAFVLDSVVKPSFNFTRQIDESAGAKERAFEAFVVWCSANPVLCDFHGGQSAAQIRDAWDGLAEELAVAGGIPTGWRTFSSVDLRRITQASFREPEYERLSTLLAQIEAGDATEALSFADQVFGRDAAGVYHSDAYADLVIACNDHFGPEKATATNFDRAIGSLYTSRFALPELAAYRACVDWPGPDPELTINAAEANAFYLVSGASDPEAPDRWADEMQTALGNRSWLHLIDLPGHVMFDRLPAEARIENFVLTPEKEPGPFSCIGGPPIVHTSSTAIRFDGQVNVFSTISRTATVPVTVSIYEQETHRLLATVTATLAENRFPSMVVEAGRPLWAYVRAEAEGFISGEHYFRYPFVQNAFVSVNLADESVFEFTFQSAPTLYDPNLTAIRIYACDCDRRRIEGASIYEDSPSGYIWYGQQRENGCAYAGANEATDAFCDPLGVNFEEGEVTLTIAKGRDSYQRRLMLRPRTFVQYDVAP